MMMTTTTSTPTTTNTNQTTASTTRTLAKHQGYLLRKRKFIGFKETYVVLQKGHIIYYHSDSDAQSDHNRKGTYSLECATIEEYQNSSPSNYLTYSWTINFPDGRQHTLCSLMSTSKKMGGIPKTPSVSTACSKITSKVSTGKSPLNPTDRKKKWIDAFKQHIEYMDAHPSEVNSYQRQMSIVPTERIEQQINILKMDQERVIQTLSQIERDLSAFSLSNLNQLNVDPNLYKCVSNYKPNFDILKLQIQVFIEDTNKCLSLQDQKDSVLQTQLADSKAKCRLLEESLRSLAHENGDQDADHSYKAPKNIKRSPSSSIGGDVVVAGSSSNTTESDSSDFDEYYDTAEEADHYNNNHRRSEKRQGGYQTVIDICNSEIKRPPNGNYLENDSEKESSTNRDSGIGSDAVVVKAGSSSSLSPSSENNDPSSWRISLPATMIDRSQISLWTIAKHFIGKELTKISMPVFLCEPLSFLQRIGENTQYSPLLTSLFDYPDPCKRMEVMAAYASSICSSIERVCKPFNPLLGETYELVREDLGFRSVSEQVSHHPPISAYHTEALDKSRYWSSYGTVNPKIKFWGKSVEVDPRGTITCDFPSLNETYYWKPGTCTIHNVIVGTPWFEYTGTMEVKCLQTGYKAVLNFRPYSRSNKELHKVDGYIFDNKGNKVKALYGYWTHCIYSCDVESFESFVEAKKPFPVAKFDKYFNVVEPLIPLNTHDSSRNLLSPNGLATTPAANRLSTQSVPRFNLSSVDGDGDDEAESGESSISRPLSQQLSQPNQPLSYLSQIGDSSKAFISSVSSLSTLMKDLCEVWRVNPQPPYSAEKFYNFSYFCMSLNELKPGMEKVLAPTDTRFRSDVRRLEYGDLDGASREKDRLEIKQREARKNQVGEYKPKWFYQGRHAQTGEEEWVFTQKYWLRDYSDCPDIY